MTASTLISDSASVQDLAFWMRSTQIEVPPSPRTGSRFPVVSGFMRFASTNRRIPQSCMLSTHHSTPIATRSVHQSIQEVLLVFATICRAATQAQDVH